MKYILCALLVFNFQTVSAKVTVLSSPATNTKEISKDDYDSALKAAHKNFKGLKEGANADYIPALKKVDSELFGIALVTPDGKVYTVGNVDKEFSIQSISKVFTMAKVLEDSGEKAIVDNVGVVATGDKFNSIVAIEKSKGHKMNSFVNPGAIATTSMVKGNTPEEIWNKIIGIHNDFAGRKLSVLEDIYKSEAATNQRNQAIGKLMNAYEVIKDKPDQATDIYTRQCSIGVNAKDLAIMAATLANGGINPVTKKKVIDQKHIKGILSVMATAGLYDTTGNWLFVTGLPAKSGVGGGLIAVSPGKFGIAAFSPRLDEAGNSVRAQKAIAYITEQLKANPYDVMPKEQGRGLASEPEEKEEVK